jgi:low temperature requirement protein LtrA
VGVFRHGLDPGHGACGRSQPARLYQALPPTNSLVERFGLFTIIVLGEVVFGIVGGLSVHDRDTRTITTGMIALGIGFGFWWIYFDLVGRRPPRPDGAAMMGWLLSHLPITLSITAAGAAMVSLIGRAHDASTPQSTTWLLCGAVALGLIALILTERSLANAERLEVVYRPLSLAQAGGAGAVLVVGWARPAPWLLALLLAAILTVLWFFAATRFLRADAWSEAQSHPHCSTSSARSGSEQAPPDRHFGDVPSSEACRLWERRAANAGESAWNFCPSIAEG